MSLQKKLIMIFILITATAISSGATEDKKFCYSRDEADKIAQCFAMQRYYEAVHDDDVAAGDGSSSFWQTPIGQVSIAILGFGLGYTVSALKK